jgi:hypothetical protein
MKVMSMRVCLWIALVGGCIGAALGFFHFLTLQTDLSRVPAIVIVPQIIQAVLVGGFGVIAATIGAAGLGLLDAAERQQATLDRIARHTVAPPAPPPQATHPHPIPPSQDRPRFTGTVSGPIQRG